MSSQAWRVTAKRAQVLAEFTSDRTRRILMDLARRHAPRGEDPECVVSQAALELMIAIERGDEIRSPLAYSKRTVCSICCGLRRRSGREVFMGDMDDFPAPQPGTWDLKSASGKDSRSSVLRPADDPVWHHLSLRERQILRVALEGVASMAELGATIGQTRRVTRERFSRLLEKLRSSQGIFADFVPPEP